MPDQSGPWQRYLRHYSHRFRENFQLIALVVSNFLWWETKSANRLPGSANEAPNSSLSRSSAHFAHRLFFSVLAVSLFAGLRRFLGRSDSKWWRMLQRKRRESGIWLPWNASRLTPSPALSPITRWGGWGQEPKLDDWHFRLTNARETSGEEVCVVLELSKWSARLLRFMPSVRLPFSFDIQSLGLSLLYTCAEGHFILYYYRLHST